MAADEEVQQTKLMLWLQHDAMRSHRSQSSTKFAPRAGEWRADGEQRAVQGGGSEDGEDTARTAARTKAARTLRERRRGGPRRRRVLTGHGFELTRPHDEDPAVEDRKAAKGRCRRDDQDCRTAEGQGRRKGDAGRATSGSERP
ncbi:hypothetical protein PF005_g13672 [Phytophthora fragariae]|uniref:Uncharacterized protein n=1 Tax=Phytophthora fragariae TaxID=53985 RepID=A0A6A3XX28_9STRA|nr:hypothetical protein PF005_g13672 [Phytophthora fragariae]